MGSAKLHRSVFCAAIMAVAALAAGCASGPPAEPVRERTVVVHENRAAAPGEIVADVALALLGVPYRYGGTSPREGFDCSGLVHYAYARAGHEVPRTSLDLFRAARKIALEDAAAGDLMFFQDQEKLSHVGIYIGDGRFVHAPASGRTVSVASIADPYYRSHLVGVGRLLTD